MNFLHIPGQGLGVLLIRIFIKTEIRSFWVRTPKGTVPECTKIVHDLLVKYKQDNPTLDLCEAIKWVHKLN